MISNIALVGYVEKAVKLEVFQSASENGMISIESKNATTLFHWSFLLQELHPH